MCAWGLRSVGEGVEGEKVTKGGLRGGGRGVEKEREEEREKWQRDSRQGGGGKCEGCG